MNDSAVKPAVPFRLDDQAQVIRLLIGILSCLQRLEAEARDCRVRLGHAVLPVRAATPPSAPLEIQAIPPVRESNGAPKSIHTHKGPAAANRLRTLRARLEVGQEEMGRRLGISGQMIGNIESGKAGISVRVHEAMVKLEARL